MQVFHRNPKTKLAGPELKKVHALGKSPVISITPAGSTEATLIAESGFITEYLTEHFGDKSAGSVLPKRWKDGQEGKVCGETEEWMRYKYFLHYAEGSLMTLMLLSLVALRKSLLSFHGRRTSLNRSWLRAFFCAAYSHHVEASNSLAKRANMSTEIKAAPGAPFFVKPITNRISKQLFDSFIGPNVKTHFEFLEGNLRTAVASESGKRYLCGPNLTAADILMSFPLIAAKGGRAGAIDKATYPLLVEYIATLEGEAGYKKSIDKIIEVEGHFDASL